MANFNKPITQDEIDMKMYNEKFDFADLVLQSEEPKPELLSYVLNDMTTFAYKWFKNDRGDRLKLYPYQDAIFKFIKIHLINWISQ